MEQLPDELAARRQSILARVTKRGRRLRRRRAAVVSAIVVLAASLPIAGVAVALRGNDGARQIQTLGPSTTEAPSTTTATTTSSAPPTTSAVSTSTTVTFPTETVTGVPVTTTSSPETSSSPDTTTPVTTACHNSIDPACGPFRYDPPPGNEPATLTIVKVEPAAPTAGESVQFTMHAKDPDSFIYAGTPFCGRTAFGDGSGRRDCGPVCALPIRFRYGPWDPPAPRPSDTTLTVSHVYTEAGTYEAHIAITADTCGPRKSEASASVTVHVST